MKLNLYNYDPQVDNALSFLLPSISVPASILLTAHNAPKVVKAASYVMFPKTGYSQVCSHNS